MRFVLVDNLIYEGPHTAPKYDLQPHLGLLSLAAVVRANGHEPEIYDPKLDLLNGHLQLESSLYEKFALRILEQHPDVVGFTALGCNFNCVVKVADHIKRLIPELLVLLGGRHATILHREILERFSSFDLVVRNEAEQTLPPLLNRLARMDIGDLPGVSYRNRYGEVICNPGKDDRERNQELFVALGLLLLSGSDGVNQKLQAGPDLRLIASSAKQMARRGGTECGLRARAGGKDPRRPGQRRSRARQSGSPSGGASRGGIIARLQTPDHRGGMPWL